VKGHGLYEVSRIGDVLYAASQLTLMQQILMSELCFRNYPFGRVKLSFLWNTILIL
jgi:hypothetical protein